MRFVMRTERSSHRPELLVAALAALGVFVATAFFFHSYHPEDEKPGERERLL